jgi:hypothetical protein
MTPIAKTPRFGNNRRHAETLIGKPAHPDGTLDSYLDSHAAWRSRK